jgi:hypothetical protein
LKTEGFENIQIYENVIHEEDARLVENSLSQIKLLSAASSKISDGSMREILEIERF